MEGVTDLGERGQRRTQEAIASRRLRKGIAFTDVRADMLSQLSPGRLMGQAMPCTARRSW
jgi:hypothetical protein